MRFSSPRTHFSEPGTAGFVSANGSSSSLHAATERPPAARASARRNSRRGSLSPTLLSLVTDGAVVPDSLLVMTLHAARHGEVADLRLGDRCGGLLHGAMAGGAVHLCVGDVGFVREVDVAGKPVHAHPRDLA